MKINSKYYINATKDGLSVRTNLFDASEEQTFDKKSDKFSTLMRIFKICNERTSSASDKNTGLTRMYTVIGFNATEIKDRLFTEKVSDVELDKSDLNVKNTDTKPKKVDPLKVTRFIQKLIDFFSEFNYSVSYRFINSFVLAPDKLSYVRNYFAVQDHPYASVISDKITQPEFTEICHAFEGCTPKPINTRFELYYGEAGAGKTTKAKSLTEKCIVCSSDMLPADLMQNFAFADGKAEFQKSDLWIAMEEGKTITLDEVNMLPFESLRFLQGITDGKDSFNYKGFEVKIHPNFKIYATMNLNVNGQCIPLPAPLVDRAYDIVEFKLTANDLLSAVLGTTDDSDDGSDDGSNSGSDTALNKINTSVDNDDKDFYF